MLSCMRRGAPKIFSEKKEFTKAGSISTECIVFTRYRSNQRFNRYRAKTTHSLPDSSSGAFIRKFLQISWVHLFACMRACIVAAIGIPWTSVHRSNPETLKRAQKPLFSFFLPKKTIQYTKSNYIYIRVSLRLRVWKE